MNLKKEMGCLCRITIEDLRQHMASSPQFEYLGVLDPKGHMVSATVGTSGDEISYAHRPYFMQAMTGKPYVSDPYISNVTFHYCVALAVPLMDGQGEVAGVLMGDLCIE